jgi:hypothetical protein
MYRLAVCNRAANHGTTIDWTGFPGRPVWRGAISCYDPIGIIFNAYDGDIGRSTNARRVLSDDI